MLWSPRLSLSNFHVKLTAKGLFRNLQLLPGCRKNTVVFHAGLRTPPLQNSVSVPTDTALLSPKRDVIISCLFTCLTESVCLCLQREESLKQKKELTQELSSLRDEMESSNTVLSTSLHFFLKSFLLAFSYFHTRFEDGKFFLKKEGRNNHHLPFYQSEWDKAQQMYQEEADKYREGMEKQVEELRSRQEAEKKKQEETHNQNMETLKQQHETSVQGQSIRDRSDLTWSPVQCVIKEDYFVLIVCCCLSQKDSHTLYLEQELEKKKLMEMNKLTESNFKLEECLTKVMQENEDYRARMDRHAALSKQLSSEQAILQQTLQKESKVNKRLSMENEELLWKLHNGDLLASPAASRPRPRSARPGTPPPSRPCPRDNPSKPGPAAEL
uniref:Microtubule associated tumor suppressor 1b n=1 Tax=Neogobius melanostomus TaxID=47308 RepID=A0A8C6SXF1_9GOBI